MPTDHPLSLFFKENIGYANADTMTGDLGQKRVRKSRWDQDDSSNSSTNITSTPALPPPPPISLPLPPLTGNGNYLPPPPPPFPFTSQASPRVVSAHDLTSLISSIDAKLSSSNKLNAVPSSVASSSTEAATATATLYPSTSYLPPGAVQDSRARIYIGGMSSPPLTNPSIPSPLSLISFYMNVSQYP